MNWKLNEDLRIKKLNDILNESISIKTKSLNSQFSLENIKFASK